MNTFHRSCTPAFRIAAVLFTAALPGHAAMIMSAGQPAQLDIRACGQHSVRVTLRPLSFVVLPESSSLRLLRALQVRRAGLVARSEDEHRTSALTGRPAACGPAGERRQVLLRRGARPASDGNLSEGVGRTHADTRLRLRKQPLGDARRRVFHGQSIGSHNADLSTSAVRCSNVRHPSQLDLGYRYQQSGLRVAAESRTRRDETAELTTADSHGKEEAP